MKIPKKDALEWFEFFSVLSEKNNENDIDSLILKYNEIIKSTFWQIEKAVDYRNQFLISKINNLKNLENRTFFVGDESKFPKGCRSCLLGNGLGSIRKTNKCNLKCKFCYYYGEFENQKPIIEDIWEIGGTQFYEKDLDLLLSTYKKPSGVAYVYMEPFIEIEKYYSIIKKFSQAQIYQHLYTNGTLATEDNLKALGEAGLDEIRFNLGASNCSDKVINNIKIAKKYIKNVGIETPMTPEFFNLFLSKKKAILDTGLDFINCAELHIGINNINNYIEENNYISRYGYISPIWSHELTLKFMKFAVDESWNLVVHDCSNYTKFARDLNSASKYDMPYGTNYYESEFSQIPFKLFLPILKDKNFNFLYEEDLPNYLKLKNVKESLISTFSL